MYFSFLYDSVEVNFTHYFIDIHFPWFLFSYHELSESSAHSSRIHTTWAKFWKVLHVHYWIKFNFTKDVRFYFSCPIFQHCVDFCDHFTSHCSLFLILCTRPFVTFDFRSFSSSSFTCTELKHTSLSFLRTRQSVWTGGWRN